MADAVDPAARERSIVRLLDAWPWQHGGVIVGGYTVAAYGRPRYSQDLDVVLPKDGLGPTIEWLQAQDPPFQKHRPGPDWAQNYATVSCWIRDDATIDLMAGAVRDRDAQVEIPYEWIAKSPRRLRLVLLDASTTNAVPVARPEAFWALKLQAGRDHDLSDLFAISAIDVDLHEVRELFKKLSRPTVEAKLRAVLKKTEGEKLYQDSLSRFRMGSSTLEKHKRAWSRFKAMVADAIPKTDE